MKKTFLAASVILSLLLPGGRARAAILAGPVTNSANGHVYYLLTAGTWTASEAEAVQLGGNLVTINDAAENGWVFTNFASFGGVDRSLWLGLNDQATEGTWTWISGEPVTFTNWASGEPNSSGGGGFEEDFALMSPNNSGIPTLTPGSWADASDTGIGITIHTPIHGVVEVICAPLPAGAVSWWRAENNALDELGGNHGTLLGGAGFAAGKVGQAFKLDGYDQHVSIAPTTSLDVGKGPGFTVEAWINPTNLPGNNSSPIFHWSDITYFWIESGGRLAGNVRDTNGVDHYLISASGIVQANQFQHVAMSYDRASGAAKLVWNGVVVASNNFGNVVARTAGTLVLGQYNACCDRFYGLIDEPTVYGRALGDAEVVSIYNTGLAGKCPVPTAAAITVQPQNKTVVFGSTVSFSVTASGTPPLTYQWRRDSNTLAGATNASLTVTNAQQPQAGDYSVVVSNAYGSATSSNATLTLVLGNYSLSGDYSLAANPNGVWRYGWKSNLLSALSLFAYSHSTTEQLGDTAQFWSRFAANDSSIAKNASAFEGGCCGGQVIHPAGAVWMTPGPNGAADNYSVTRFTVPSGGDGVYQVVGLAETDANGSLGGDTEFHFVRSGSLRFSSFLPASTSLDTTNRAGFTNVLALAAGETLDFLVGRGQDGNYNYSFAEVAVSVTQTAAGGVGPEIVGQPTNRTVTAGGTASFSVQAVGTGPLAYQWLFNSNVINGATNSSLTWTNVQMTQAGPYSVVVSNAYGSTTSSNATLTVTPPPANVRVLSVNGTSAGSVNVPVALVANGNENGVSFSLNFSNAVLTLTGVALGSGAPGASLVVNSNLSGKVGLLVGLPFGETFSPGTQQVVTVGFSIAPVTNAMTNTITFGDSPVTRQLSDVGGATLSATYSNGSVVIASVDFEGDVSPRPTGNKALTLTDWVQVGRFAAGLDTAATGGEFQRADCAPRSTSGNGNITLTDYVQAGRYAAGLDPLTPVGGPTNASSSFAAAKSAPGAEGTRSVAIASTTLQPGQTNSVTVQLIANGDENGISTSVNFNPVVMSFVSAVPGSDAAGASLLLNPNQLASGRVGVVLALPTGNSFAAGTRNAITLNFAMTQGATGCAPVTFSDQPVPRELSDALANVLAGSYTDGALTLNGGAPALSIARGTGQVELAWPVTVVGFTLESITNLLEFTNWTGVGTPPSVIGTSNVVALPDAPLQQFFRLRKP